MTSKEQTPNDNRSDSMNPLTRAGKKAAENRARQIAKNKER